MPGFPTAARSACWLNAWIAGRESTDEVIGGLAGETTSVAFHLDGEVGSLPPGLALGVLRRRDVHRVSLCLPLPGSLVGLGGPPVFNADALDAEEAMIWHGAAVGFTPVWVGGCLTWRGSVAAPPTYLPDVATADRELRAALASTAQRLADLDVASWSPDTADALMNLWSPRSSEPRLPFASPAAARVAATALRCTAIVELASVDDGGAVSAQESAARREALRPLEAASRSALVAACSEVG